MIIQGDDTLNNNKIQLIYLEWLTRKSNEENAVSSMIVNLNSKTTYNGVKISNNCGQHLVRRSPPFLPRV